LTICQADIKDESDARAKEEPMKERKKEREK